MSFTLHNPPPERVEKGAETHPSKKTQVIETRDILNDGF